MSDPLDITAEQARKIVLSESQKKGWARPELRNTRKSLGAQSICTYANIPSDAAFADIPRVARGISARRGRFILELIQNAEDCDFRHTNIPSISFEVSPQKIIVESNQDGFRALEISQICHTGNSWKRARRGFVGEKGIGFKSVFQIASRVE
jgi:hypothetical protein